MPATRDVDQLFAMVFAVLAGLYLLRAGLGVGLYAAGLIPGRVGSRCQTLSTRVTPRLVRRVGSALLSATAFSSVVGGVVGVAPATATATAINLDRGPIINSPPRVDKHQPTPSSTPPPATPTVTHQGQTVVVRPGDCLWSIAARHLPAGASAAEIDRSWRRWYELNRNRIGPDPNLIAAGTRLRAPR